MTSLLKHEYYRECNIITIINHITLIMKTSYKCQHFFLVIDL